jgi:rubredoxin
MRVGSICAKMIPNESGDGWKPTCSECGYEFEDAETDGSIKNYPEDGGVIVFFNCPHCKDEVHVFATYGEKP